MGGSHLLTYQTQSYTAHVCCQITLLNKFVGHVRSYETKGYMVSHMYFTFLKFAWNSWSCPSSQKFSVQLMIIVFYISYTLILIFHKRSLNHVEDTSNNSCIFYPCRQHFIHNMWFTSMTNPIMIHNVLKEVDDELEKPFVIHSPLDGYLVHSQPC